ncbi:hypothetical protein FRB91_003222 [Serendipita sp. 411]|nr:hypothetical protein FRC19_009864 [Serendipita sp. 401]KAG8843645.1 hypothetical protein FRB91_003222 [Serendipita sp. 411]
MSTMIIFLFSLFTTLVNAKFSTPPTFQLVYTLNQFDVRNISSWSGGDGPRTMIPNDTAHPFQGREFGGGKRSEIRGTRAFGSGYPYGASDPNTIAGRPFPFGTWPLWWGNNVKGSDEYGPEFDGIRPGGQVVVHPVSSTLEYFNVSADETYYLVADRESSFAMMTSLVAGCHAISVWPIVYDPKGNLTNSTEMIKIENVVQYYRASSFALAYKGYNNTFALNTTTDAGYDQSSPLPEVILYSDFYKCIDRVLADGIPIVDRPKLKTKTGMIVGIVIGSLAFISLIWFCFGCKDSRYN